VIKVGFIGNGSMGSMLIDSLLSAGKLNSSEIIVSNKNATKSDPVKNGWDEINVAIDNIHVVKTAKYVFLCTEPSEAEEVLKQIKDCVTEDTNIISTGFPASICCMESVMNCKVSKLAPTMISENGKRISVICHNNKVEENEADYIESLLCGTCNARVYKARRF
jgi:pyrroline-5-carboxylate reductase